MTLEALIPLKARTGIAALTFAAVVMPLPAAADAFTFSTGSPDGRIGTLSRPTGPGQIQTETADDFILSAQTSITQATFTGLIPSGANITNVEIEFYHVFPRDSANPPSGNVVSRTNSPADVEIAAATRDAAAGSLSFSSSVLNSTFTVANTVVNGINKQPNQFTGGEGSATGQEVRISVNFLPSVDLPADHYFFRPEAAYRPGTFYCSRQRGRRSSPAIFRPGYEMIIWRPTGSGSAPTSLTRDHLTRAFRSPAWPSPAPSRVPACRA